MQSQHRIRLRLGDLEFDAEGSASDVMAQFREFMRVAEAVKGIRANFSDERTYLADAQAQTREAGRLAAGAATAVGRGSVGDVDSARGVGTEKPVVVARLVADRENLELLFSVDDKGAVYLTSAFVAAFGSDDKKQQAAVVLILYGYLHLRDKALVTGYWLMKSLELSGFESLDRIDRVVNPNHVHNEGKYRGKKYGLTAKGIGYADLLAESILAEAQQTTEGSRDGKSTLAPGGLAGAVGGAERATSKDDGER